MTHKVTNFRVRFVIDEEGRFEECNGESRPLTEDEYVGNCYMKDGKPVPYSEYLRYYGNPDRHIYLGCIVDGECPCCLTWDEKAALWGIDVMDDDKALREVQLNESYTAEEASKLPNFFGEIAREQLEEARSYADVR